MKKETKNFRGRPRLYKRPSAKTMQALRDEGLTLVQCIKRLKLKCSDVTYVQWEQDAGLPPRKHQEELLHFEKVTLETLINRGMTRKQMSEALGISTDTLYRFLRMYGLSRVYTARQVSK